MSLALYLNLAKVKITKIFSYVFQNACQFLVSDNFPNFYLSFQILSVFTVFEIHSNFPLDKFFFWYYGYLEAYNLEYRIWDFFKHFYAIDLYFISTTSREHNFFEFNLFPFLFLCSLLFLFVMLGLNPVPLVC
jgi:hypothetical protein